MKKSILLLSALLFGIILFDSCKKTDDANDLQQATSEDVPTTEDFSDEIDVASDVAFDKPGRLST